MRFYIENISGDIISVSKETAAHFKAARVKCGDTVTLFDGSGKDYVCTLEEFSKNNARLQVVQTLMSDIESNINVTLFMSLIKADKFEFVIQKAVELGVNTIVPVITRYVQPVPLKYDRLKKIAINACEQCGRSFVPQIKNAVYFEDLLLLTNSYDNFIFAFEKQTDKSTSMKDIGILPNTNVALLIGPEGGFADFEVNALIHNNIKPITLGKRILRAETAAIAALANIYLMAEAL